MLLKITHNSSGKGDVMIWRATLHQKVTEVLWLAIEAPTEAEARELALKEATAQETWPQKKFEDDAIVVACNPVDKP